MPKLCLWISFETSNNLEVILRTSQQAFSVTHFPGNFIFTVFYIHKVFIQYKSFLKLFLLSLISRIIKVKYLVVFPGIFLSAHSLYDLNPFSLFRLHLCIYALDSDPSWLTFYGYLEWTLFLLRVFMAIN